MTIKYKKILHYFFCFFLTFITFNLYAATVPLPVDAATGGLQFARFISITCSNNNCLAVGDYKNTDLAVLPLLAFSTDNGNTFTSAITIPLPNDTAIGPDSSGALTSINCSALQCTALGAYRRLDGGFLPFIAHSTDGGQTFTTSLDITLPEDSGTGGGTSAALFSLKCIDQNCLAIGAYQTLNNGIVPLCAFSIDGGNTYTTTSDVILPNDARTGNKTNALLVGLTCTGSNCHAVGGYRRTDGGFGPLLGFSSDNGQTYHTATTLTLPVDAAPGLFTYAPLLHVTCVDNNCIAAGGYANVFGGLAPLIVLSSDGGQTYTTLGSATLPIDAATGKGQYVGFSDLNCIGSTCLAVGAYKKTNESYAPLYALSVDGGQTFNCLN